MAQICHLGLTLYFMLENSHPNKAGFGGHRGPLLSITPLETYLL